MDNQAACEGGLIVSFCSQREYQFVAVRQAVLSPAPIAVPASLVLDGIHDIVNEFGSVGSAQTSHIIPAVADGE